MLTSALEKLNDEQILLQEMSAEQKEDYYKQKSCKDFDANVLALKPVNMTWIEFEKRMRAFVSMTYDLPHRDVLNILTRRNNLKIDDYQLQVAYTSKLMLTTNSNLSPEQI